ncbi:MAG: hypothetical protein HY222_01495 [Thaumarchaeota archaeon]|nr:hypothetical protein [Nitrososphaerota archaeon]
MLEFFLIIIIKISHQRVVTSEEFEKIVVEGWQYLGTLPNGKIVVKNRQGSDSQ